MFNSRALSLHPFVSCGKFVRVAWECGAAEIELRACPLPAYAQVVLDAVLGRGRGVELLLAQYEGLCTGHTRD
jgi:hypothetical protein